MKIWMIKGGGDWADASATLVAADSDVDMYAKKDEYNRWYREVYVPSDRNSVEYRTFEEWLLDKGLVREPTEDEAEELEA